MTDFPNTDENIEDNEAVQQDLPLAWSTGETVEVEAGVEEEEAPKVLKLKPAVEEADFAEESLSEQSLEIAEEQYQAEEAPRPIVLERAPEESAGLTLMSESYEGEVLTDEQPPAEPVERTNEDELEPEPVLPIDEIALGDCESLGQYLCQIRHSRGKSIQDVVDSTGIRPEHVEAIEADDYVVLPEYIYTSKFIKIICNEYEIDSAEVLEHYKNISGANETVDRTVPSGEIGNLMGNRYGKLVGIISSVAGLILLVCLGLSWFSSKGPMSLSPTEQSRLDKAKVEVNNYSLDLRQFSAAAPNLPLPLLEVPQN